MKIIIISAAISFTCSFCLLCKVAAGAAEVAVFGSASETFSKHNINCSIDESMLRFEEVINSAKEQNIPVRGFVFFTLHSHLQGLKPCIWHSPTFWFNTQDIEKKNLCNEIHTLPYAEEHTRLSNNSFIAKLQMCTKLVNHRPRCTVNQTKQGKYIQDVILCVFLLPPRM